MPLALALKRQGDVPKYRIKPLSWSLFCPHYSLLLTFLPTHPHTHAPTQLHAAQGRSWAPWSQIWLYSKKTNKAFSLPGLAMSPMQKQFQGPHFLPQWNSSIVAEIWHELVRQPGKMSRFSVTYTLVFMRVWVMGILKEEEILKIHLISNSNE